MTLIKTARLNCIFVLTACTALSSADDSSPTDLGRYINTSGFEVVAPPLNSANHRKMVEEKFSLAGNPDIKREEVKIFLKDKENSPLHIGFIALTYENSPAAESALQSIQTEGHFKNSKILTPYKAQRENKTLCIVYSETYFHPERESISETLLQNCADFAAQAKSP
ncbi:hypothetical protein DWB84_07485 [Saccharophagus sp. K07]|uniref:hypothetical protein n=1 Tax=Saccharophagus sp. K07 TaxID=2283636 RepID=UPI00165233DB|nr:hypothetical protein [Saccharophagus sp. K07]MBC6905299.1 hypothetical protein [Saccharophagus sp. K07]